VWVAWRQGSECYVGANSTLGSVKISLHQSGICRLALSERHYNELPEMGLKQPADRALTKWRRLPTPEAGVVHVLSLIFPTDHLRLEEPKSSQKKPVMIFEPPPAGQAVQMGFFYSRQTGPAMEASFLNIGAHPLFTFDLRNGDTVWMAAKQIPFDRKVLPMAPLTMNPESVLDRTAIVGPGETRGNLTAHFWNAPKDGEPFYLWEVGGAVIRGPKLEEKT
jgi:hypothetical protein